MIKCLFRLPILCLLTTLPVWAAAPGSLVDTTQADFESGTLTNIDTTISPGDVSLSLFNGIDQQNLTVGTSGVGITITTWGGQTFTPATTGSLTKVEVNLFASGVTGTTPNLTVSLRATGGGLPTGADLATATIAGFNNGASAFYTAVFASPITVTAGTMYAIVVRPTANPSPGTYALTRSGTSTAGADVYAGGTRVAGATSGTVWSIPLTGGVSTDAGFKIYVTSSSTYFSSGDIISSLKDGPAPAGSTIWSTLSWTAATPTGTSVRFQVAGNNDSAGTFDFVGPDGTASTYFTTSGASLSQFSSSRYLKYRAYLATTNTAVTPTLRDVTVAYNPPVAAPVINSSLAASGTYGSLFSYTITASDTPTSYSATGLPDGLGINTSTGVISGTPTAAAISATPHSVSISATNGGGTDTQTLSLTINKAVIGVVGTTATKNYDGTTAATNYIDYDNVSLTGRVGTDNVGLDAGNTAATFDTAAVGTGKIVTITGLALVGAQSSYYVLGAVSAAGTINAKPLTISGLAASKVYDGTTAVAVTGTPALLASEAITANSGTDGKPYTGQNVALSGTVTGGTFANRHVGNNKAVMITGLSLTGSDAGNYVLNTSSSLVANITKKPLTVTGLTIMAKTYDGTTAASLSGTPTLLATGIAGSGTVSDGKPYSVDSVTITGTASGSFGDRNVGTGKTVTITGLSLTGADNGNYSLSPNQTADITPKALTVTGLSAVSTRIYDGTTIASLAGTAAFQAAEAAGSGTTSDGKPYTVDTIAIGGTAAGAFADRHVGTAKAITVSGLTVTGIDSANYSVAQPTGLTAAITKKTLTVSGVTASNKVYDGTHAATISGTPTLQAAEAPGSGTTSDGKPYTGDTFSASGTLTGTFADRGAAAGKTITIAGITLTGAEAGNYDVGALSTTADITPKALMVFGLSAGAPRVYDGTVVAGLAGAPAFATAEATGTGTTSDGIPYTVDAIAIGGTATGVFADRHVGVAKGITVSGLTVTGTDSVNYTVIQPTGLIGEVTAKALSVFGLSAVPTRVYDTTTTAALTGTAAFATAEAAGTGTTSDGIPYTVDTIAIGGTAAGAFADKTVGTAKAITVSGITITGTDSANYTVAQPTGLTADVTAAGLTVSGVTAQDKTYNGNLAASLNTGSAALVGVLPGDTVTLNVGSAAGTFGTKVVGTGKPVTVAGIAIGGADAGNYALTQPTTTASITAKPITVDGITVANKVYDGNTTAVPTYTGAHLVSVVPGDTVTFVSGGGTATFASKTVGTGKSVSFAGLTLGDADAGNYSLTQPTATADITAKTLTVSGITASDKAYDGTAVATLNTGSAALVGVVLGDTVTLSTAGATGVFADTSVGGGKPVQITGLALGGADSGNYTLTQPAATAAISAAAVAITISNTSFVYDGTPKAPSIVASPDVPLSISYSNGPLAPRDAGTYIASVTVISPHHTGSASAIFTIAKAPQTLTFEVTGADFKVGSTLGLSATANTGLPVTFSVVSGSATLSGSSATIAQPGPITLRAAQAGNENYLAATAERTFTGVAATKAEQTISFAALPNVAADSGGFVLSATATSGLPVSFAVVSGPATVSGNRVTLTGAIGDVTIRASQAGDDSFLPAPMVDRTFTVVPAAPSIFFGSVANGGAAAAAFFPETGRGTLLITAPASGVHVVLDFKPDATGAFSVPFQLDGRALTLTGTLSGGTLAGGIPGLDLTFSATVQSRTGPASNIAGLYESVSANNASRGIATIVGAGGQLLMVAHLNGAFDTGGTGRVEGNGFDLLAAGNVGITGAFDLRDGTLAGNIAAHGSSPVPFRSLSATAPHTDRLVNLSSLSRSAPNAGRALIVGFVIGGTSEKRILLRGVGPALAGFGVTNAMANPRLQLFDASSRLLLENDDWSGADTSAVFVEVGAFALPTGSRDAALLTTLRPGAYTVQITGGTESGIVLAEIYDASANVGAEPQRMINSSARGMVEAGADGALIGGFVVTGNVPKKVLIRGVGPALGAFGVSGALADPSLTLYRGSLAIARNDNWSTPTPVGLAIAATAPELAAAAQDVGAFALGANSKDAALIVTLDPGAYTAQVTGAGGSTGVALVEVYELP